MSLQVWLPLNGNLENQGLADVTVTNNGATVDSNGKVGKCYGFDGTNDYITLICQDFPTIFRGLFSITFWVCSNDDGTRSIYFGNYGISGGGNWFNLEKHTANEIRFWWNDGNPDKRFNTSKIIQSDGWTHFALTKNGGVVKTYLNGELIETYTNENLSTDVPSTATTFRIGGDYRTSGDLMFNGKMNDFRLYDHALSAKEIKELSRGLVLHYKLSGVGGENLLTNTKTFTIPSGGNGLTTDTYNGFIVRHLSPRSGSSYREVAYYNSFIPVESEGLYTQSFWAKGTGKLKCHFYSGNIACATNTSNQGVSNTATDGAIDITLTSDWKRYWVTHMLKSSSDTPTNKSILLRCWDGENEVYVCGWKCEKGYKATPWCPNPSDPEYTFLEYNSTTEYDYSGFGNDGTITVFPKSNANTIRYSTSYAFNSTDKTNINFPAAAIPTEEITISLWGYKDNWNAAERLGGRASNSSGWCIGDYGSENTMFGFYLESGSGSYNTITGFRQLTFGWHHFAITFDGYNLKYYLDGECKSTKTWSTKQTFKRGTSTVYNLGSHTNSSYYFNGNMSDFRIYATPLSEKDIKELYTVGTAFDKQGRVMTYEVVEV